MITSMTAFGRCEDSGDWGHATWEIRTVNHRYLEISLRLPEDLRQLEATIREGIASRLNRGKVDCTLRYEREEARADSLGIDTELAARLIRTAESLPLANPAPIDPIDILRWPDVIRKAAVDIDTVSTPLLKLLDTTLDLLVETRRREGDKIRGLILDRCETARILTTRLRGELPDVLETLRERILSRARELAINLDQERLEQEMVLLAQKMDVAEEMDRLQAHIEEVCRVMEAGSPAGRRLDFLMQEMNREANTLGSKSASIEFTNASVELKVLIEQMREQIQNVE